VRGWFWLGLGLRVEGWLLRVVLVGFWNEECGGTGLGKILTVGAEPESAISTSAGCSVGACCACCARPFVRAGSMSGFATAGFGVGSVIFKGSWGFLWLFDANWRAWSKGDRAFARWGWGAGTFFSKLVA
jgi:hypothetical protein